ncbi:MAG: YajQ family cyclic di-GMP-binding protein [Candidatus Marinimicrobia bacterium]|nr:YajQ family cyclic di-GMP-binding protein [Candidatus Neomarinimicrobiota bacterium]MBT5956231.1 YajQ family cyclic di-GMP-binding protein [Candidatus Neomarinimicrobiota bacterium]|tara:strand:+ start:2184 stop:2675 length:492 start_codon:yes stop_codon:yes gene_type:complete
MATFDVVNKLDMQEVDNTINMVTRDIANRYDFKGSSTNLSLNKSEKTIKLEADNNMQLTAVRDMLENRAISRKLSIKIFDFQNEENASGMSVRQIVKLREGISTDNAKKINKMIKDMKLKVQSQIQGEQLRVTGKKIDDLQSVITALNEAKLDFPLQFVNMKS